MDPARTPTAYVVDDDDSIRTLWRWLMESNGIAVRTFASAGEFIECYRSEPGCLVLDVRLPGMSGLELQDYLRRNGVEFSQLRICASYRSAPRCSRCQRPVTIDGHTTLTLISGPRERASDKVIAFSAAFDAA